MSRPNLSGTVVASKFHLERRLGQGHFGDVYLVEHTVLGRRAALKIVPVDASTKDAKALEAKLLSLSNHPHIVKIYSAEYWKSGSGSDFFIIEMEYVPGGDLQGLIQRGSSIPEMIGYIKNILFALDHAHPDVIHRDIKPANILLGGGGKLSDFGIALVSSTGLSASPFTYNGNLAPECYSVPPDFSPLSDLYAVGLTLFRCSNMVTNWRTARFSVPDWRAKMADGTFLSTLGYHPRVPKKLRTIINKACAKNPLKRYTSAATFRDALEALKIDRDWRATSSNRWQCEFDGSIEEINIKSVKNTFSVDYTRGGRRKAVFCKSALTQPDAERYAFNLIASTTFT